MSQTEVDGPFIFRVHGGFGEEFTQPDAVSKSPNEAYPALSNGIFRNLGPTGISGRLDISQMESTRHTRCSCSNQRRIHPSSHPPVLFLGSISLNRRGHSPLVYCLQKPSFGRRRERSIHNASTQRMNGRETHRVNNTDQVESSYICEFYVQQV